MSYEGESGRLRRHVKELRETSEEAIRYLHPRLADGTAVRLRDAVESIHDDMERLIAKHPMTGSDAPPAPPHPQHTDCAAPDRCACECLECKRAYFAAGRPILAGPRISHDEAHAP